MYDRLVLVWKVSKIGMIIQDQKNDHEQMLNFRNSKGQYYNIFDKI